METGDRDAVYREYFDKKQREYLRKIISDSLIEEHRRDPLGQHSEPLERLLAYFRRAHQPDTYVVKRDQTSGAFRIARLTGDRNVPLLLIDETAYASAEAAYHGIFLRRVDDLLKSATNEQ